jgi:hypothetical protein
MPMAIRDRLHVDKLIATNSNITDGLSVCNIIDGLVVDNSRQIYFLFIHE